MKELTFDLPILLPITGQKEYRIDCRTQQYAALVIGKEDSLLPKSYVRLEEGDEQSVIYVNGDIAQYFGADYSVIQDDSQFLVMVRSYPGSGLTEVITINKDSGLGFDTKTTGTHIGSQPTSTTYFIACTEI